MSKNVCIVGAGPSGLVSAKEVSSTFPEYSVQIFEKKSTLGGVFSDSYNGLQLVNNPFLVGFSDFLPSVNGSVNMKMWKTQEYVDYLHKYAEKNDIMSKISFDTSVTRVERKRDGWEVFFVKNNERRSDFFDDLIICSGVNHVPGKVKNLPNQDRFTGEIYHSGEIKDVNLFKDKNVLFVGMGETSSDFAYLVSEIAKKCIVSVRRWPGYFIPRYHDGMPTDLDTSKIYHSLPKSIDNTSLSFLMKLKRKLEYKYITSQKDKVIQKQATFFNDKNDQVRHLGPFRRITTKSCGFVKAFLKGKAAIRSGVSNIEGNTIFFSDDTRENIDIIVLCTGYTFDIGFLPKDIREKISSPKELYKYIIIPEEEHIFFVGFIRPNLGSVPAVSELQSRFICSLMRGDISLPNNEKLMEDIEDQKNKAEKQFPVDFERVPHLVDFYTYTRSLAKQIKALPKQWNLFFRDFLLWYKVNFSCLSPGIYRLYGPNADYIKVSKTLKKLPTMPFSILFIEVILYLSVKTLQFFRFENYKNY